MSRLIDFFVPLARIRNDVDEFLQGAFPGAPAYESSDEFPAVNVWESADKAFVEAEIPGVAADQIDISVTGSEVTIRGERKPPGAKDGNWVRQEREYGQFSKTMELPFDLDASQVEAVLKDGVLTITLAKAAQSQPKKVSVRRA